MIAREKKRFKSYFQCCQIVYQKISVPAICIIIIIIIFTLKIHFPACVLCITHTKVSFLFLFSSLNKTFGQCMINANVSFSITSPYFVYFMIILGTNIIIIMGYKFMFAFVILFGFFFFYPFPHHITRL